MENNQNKRIVIIGAGPAGLAAAYRLSQNKAYEVSVIEKEGQVGGLSRTTKYKGYRMDIGPHRFFSKSTEVNKFWEEVIKEKDDFRKVNRLTRILFLNKFFNYPINLNIETLKNLGLLRSLKIAISYFKIQLFPIKPEKSLADFYTNRFGKELYETFFKDYTKKIWGISCENIPPDWGSQRVKGLSLFKVLKDFFGRKSNFQFKKETSLIESFKYPKYGAGQMYENAAEKIISMGGKIKLETNLTHFYFLDNKIISLDIKNTTSGETENIKADYVISSMPIKELLEKSELNIPGDIKNISDGLIYRDYIIIGLLLDKAEIKNAKLKDNWIYIQERIAKMGRLDIFNNFSLDMLEDKNLTWLGAEYFCDEGDEIWSQGDEALADLAFAELKQMGFKIKERIDYKVLRIKNAYPAYFGSYKDFDKLREYLKSLDNLYPVGRNGMHRYNNMDHSILSGLKTADLIISGGSDKESIWQINTEQEYHEEK